MNKPERSSPPRPRGTGSPDHACEGSPPIDVSSTGNASSALAGDPGDLNPIDVGASTSDVDDEVGWGLLLFIADTTDCIFRLHWISRNGTLMGIRLSRRIQREFGKAVVIDCYC